MIVKKELRHRDISMEKEFCFYTVEKQTNHEDKIYYLHVIEGKLGEIGKCEVQILEELDQIQKEIISIENKFSEIPNFNEQIQITINYGIPFEMIENNLNHIIKTIRYACSNSGIAILNEEFNIIVEGANSLTFTPIQVHSYNRIKEILFNLFQETNYGATFQISITNLNH
jgi:hypothetical protein